VPQLLATTTDLSDEKHLRWLDWTRYSSRQQQEMTLGGAVGTWRFTAPADTLAALWPWLWLGQWLHIGKNATMGMGGYTMDIIESRP
jgi:CRISPR/Cas system endoribonuclease Cas6 (RAMP superfamily)